MPKRKEKDRTKWGFFISPNDPILDFNLKDNFFTGNCGLEEWDYYLYRENEGVSKVDVVAMYCVISHYRKGSQNRKRYHYTIRVYSEREREDFPYGKGRNFIPARYDSTTKGWSTLRLAMIMATRDFNRLVEREFPNLKGDIKYDPTAQML